MARDRLVFSFYLGDHRLGFDPHTSWRLRQLVPAARQQVFTKAWELYHTLEAVTAARVDPQTPATP